MGKNKSANKPLTQEEIWDDSALVQSWDEAVDEYQLYHSIHAKGENIEDVLREAEVYPATGGQDQGQEPDAGEQDDHMETDGDSVAVEAPSESQPVSQVEASQTTEKQEVPSSQPSGGNPMTAASPIGAAMPHAALSQVQDEGLKNLMMSWYFAGYYTGLYEGQQKANQNKSS